MTEHVYFHNPRGHKLAGVLEGEVRDVAVVSCHGMLSTKDGPKHVLLADALARRGVPSLRFDFAGRGESEGSLYDLTYSNEVEDLAAAIDFLAARGVRRIGLFGSSLGGAVALLAAARDERVVAIATLAAVGHAAGVIERNDEAMRSFARRGYIETESGRIGRAFLDDARSHDVVSAVRILHAPILVIHGEDDEVVPSSDAHDIATSARNASLEIVAGAGHEFEEPVQLRPVVRRVVDFFSERLG